MIKAKTLSKMFCLKCKSAGVSKILTFRNISSFHNLVVTLLKTFYKKQTPKITHYRNHKNFEDDIFRQDLKKELLKFDITNAPLSKFNDTVLSVLDKHAPKKMKYIRSNNCNFMTREPKKANTNTSKLRNKFLKTRS